MKLRSKKFYRSISSSKQISSNNNSSSKQIKGGGNDHQQQLCEIKWELRPGGMLVQRREAGQSVVDGLITIRVSTVSKWHDISIESTSTFGNYLPLSILVRNYKENPLVKFQSFWIYGKRVLQIHCCYLFKFQGN